MYIYHFRPEGQPGAILPVGFTHVLETSPVLLSRAIANTASVLAFEVSGVAFAE